MEGKFEKSLELSISLLSLLGFERAGVGSWTAAGTAAGTGAVWWGTAGLCVPFMLLILATLLHKFSSGNLIIIGLFLANCNEILLFLSQVLNYPADC